MYKNFKELQASLSITTPKTLVVAAAHDAHTLEAVFIAAKALPIRYILVGDRKKIMTISKKLDNIPDLEYIIDGGDNADCACKAIALIREGRGDALMKGILETSTLLKAVLDKENGIRDAGTMSHLAMLESPSYHKLVAVTDGGMIPCPTLEQKATIVRNATYFYHGLGVKCPKIAALSASEAVSGKMPETMDASELHAMCDRGELGESLLEGPMSFDIAISRDAAEIKGYSSQISGDVDIFLAPNITVGNVLCKSLLYWGGAKMAGCVLGAKVPIVLVSRGATAEEKLLSITLCLGARQTNTKREKRESIYEATDDWQ